jgi:predicted TIM-barrel fold metal-dependent hydrolase
MIIDGHFHVWPDHIAERAMTGVADGIERRGDGTARGAVAAMDEAGIDRAICLGVAVRPEHVIATNQFVGSLDPQRFIGFGSLHPGVGVEETLASLRANGLLGVKVHPLFQGYGLDDPGLWTLLDAIQGEFAVIAHIGEGGHGAARCTPPMLRDLVRRFPRLDLIACHFGGYHLLPEAEEIIIGLPVYLDTSWPPSVGTLDPARVRRAIERHGPERVIYASDWPMADPATELAAVRALGVSEDDTAAVLGGNLARLLGIAEEGRD